MAKKFFGPFILCLAFSLFFSHARSGDNNAKTAIVRGILKKVLNLTQASFSNITNQGRKNMLIDIKEKLKKSSLFLGPIKSEKYVNLIMDGISTLTIKNTNSFDNVWDDRSNEGYNGIVNAEMTSIRKTGKINAIAAKYIKQAKTPEQREDIVSDIQKQVIDAAIKKHVSMNPQDAPKLDTNSVAHAVIMMMSEVKKMSENALKKPNGRRMELKINDNKIQESEYSPEKIDSNAKEIEPNITLPCANRNTIICDRIKSLRIVKCSIKDSSLYLENLCDGVNDCSDHTDEHYCAFQGIETIQSASQIMSDIDRYISDNCSSIEINHTLIAKQNEILRHVLKSQLKFIQKHATERATNPQQNDLKKDFAESETVKKTVHEVAVVITSMTFALERILCSNIDSEGTSRLNALEDILQKDFDYEAAKTTTWSPNSCKCIEDYCDGTCNKDCQTLCLKRYQIDRWQCKSVSNKKSVPLDLICDGKLDCLDESDENGCAAVTGFEKFEAAYLYNLIIEMIITKSKAAKFESIRGMLINLQGLTKGLQKLTSKKEVDVTAVKTLRDQCFSLMTSIYDRTKYYAVNMDVMHEIHRFLMIVNDKLVIALKHSHTGNEIIKATEECLCSQSKCALQRCSKTCIRACPAEPRLTRYLCGGSMMMNQSIPLEAVCNGKVDCPSKDDEDCNLDICRKHHLVLLRHNLWKVATNQGFTTNSCADTLIPWITKQETAILRVLEKNERPTPIVLRNTVREMLNDLVMAYANSSIPKRRNEDVMQQFYTVALVVMNALKSCAK